MANRRGCDSGKASYPSHHAAALGARKIARTLHREGKITLPMFSYDCHCGRVHLTSQRSYRGKPNREALVPVNPQLQVELMDEEAREKYLAREGQERAREAEEVYRRLPFSPSSRTQAQPYANRPRSLRYR